MNAFRTRFVRASSPVQKGRTRRLPEKSLAAMVSVQYSKAVSLFGKKPSVRWSQEALARLEQIPFFVRPFIKKRAEEVARERGLTEITSELLAQLRKDEHPHD